MLGQGPPKIPVVVALGQSNEVGQDGSVVGWPGANPAVTFYDYNSPLGGEVPTGPTPLTVLAPRNSGLHGCELTLANGLVQAPNPVYYVKNAINGTSIAYWLPGGPGNASLLDAVDRAVAFGQPRLAVQWWQGEADALRTTAAYLADLNTLAAMIRTRAGVNVDVGMFIVQLNVNVSLTYANIRTAQYLFCQQDQNAFLTNLDNIVPNAGIHYGTGQQLTVGTQMIPQYARFFQ